MSTPALAGQPDTACMRVGQGEGDNQDTAEILETQLKEVNRNYCDIEWRVLKLVLVRVN